MEDEYIIEIIQIAINRLIERDGILLEIDANERSITHRLGIYLQELFPQWDVDCEYNRLFDAKKQVSVTKSLMDEIGGTTTDDAQAKTVFPDIIIHHRTTQDNLVVIEVKKTTNPSSKSLDIRKLLAFKCQLGYQIAIFIRFRTNNADFGVQDFEII